MLVRKKRGFTLIELLVVIAIIAILAAILFPVFARAREAARKSTCQSNIKQCAVALNTYWNDYDAKIPSSAVAWSNQIPAPTGVMPDPMTATLLNSFLAGNGANNGLPPNPTAARSTWAQIIWSNMKSKDIAFCPSDSNKDLPVIPSYSYWWKPAADLAWRDTTINAQKEGDYAYNADQVIFYEHAGFHAGEAGIKGGTQINLAYMDSHVKTSAVPHLDAPVTSPVGGYFNDPTKITTTQGEPMFYNYNNDRPGEPGIPSGPQGHVPPSPTYTDPDGRKGIDPRRFSDKL